LLNVQFLNDHADLEPTTNAERVRLASIESLFKAKLEASGRYKFVSIPADAAAKMAAGPEIGACCGCEFDYGSVRLSAPGGLLSLSPVKPKSRSRSSTRIRAYINSALMRHLATLGREAGLRELIAEVLSENVPMLNVFERSGLATECRRTP
jgi:Protein of unknown function (DUF2380)